MSRRYIASIPNTYTAMKNRRSRVRVKSEASSLHFPQTRRANPTFALILCDVAFKKRTVQVSPRPNRTDIMKEKEMDDLPE